MSTAESPILESSVKGSPGRGFPPSADSRETVRVLNWKLLIGTFVALIVLVPAIYFWHGMQVNRTAVVYIDRAEKLEQEGKYAEAAECLHRYLRVRPSGPDAAAVRVRLAKTFDQAATDPGRKQRAIELYFRAVGLAPRDESLRRRLGELLLEDRRFSGAEEQAAELLKLVPQDPVGLRVAALAAYGRFALGERAAMGKDDVLKTFHRALRVDPANIQLSSTLARIYRQDMTDLEEPNRLKLADEVMNRLVEANPTSAEARLARYAYRLQYELEGTQEDIDAALKLGPNDLSVVLTAGEHALRQGVLAAKEKRTDQRIASYQKAEAAFRKAIEIAPKDERGHLGLGQTFLAQNKAGLAVDTWREGLKAVGEDNIELNARLGSQFIMLGRFDEAREHLETLEAAIDRLSPRLSRIGRNAASSAIDFLRAKWHAGQGNHRQTVTLLRGVIATRNAIGGTQRNEAEQFEAWMLLGNAYSNLSQWDQAAAAFDEAVALRPASTQARLGAAQAWSNAGRLGAANAHFEQILGEQGAPAGVWLASMETRLKRQLSLPSEQRNWQALYEQLSNAPSEVRDTWQLRLLQADYVLASGGRPAIEKAVALLKQAEQRHPKDQELLQRLVVIYERLGQSADAERVLREFARLVGRSARLYLVQAELLAGRGKVDDAVQLLESGLKRLPEQQHTALLYGKVQLILRQGKLAEAQQVLAQLHQMHPSNAAVVRELAELSFELRAFDDVEKWERKLAELEGSDSTHWRYYRARRLLAQTESSTDPRFVEALELQKKIIAERPSWAAGQLLRGLVAQRQGKLDQAIDAYQTAIDLGESRLGVYEQLIELLYQAQRFAEAEKFLARLQDNVALSDRLSSVEISLAYQRGEKERAIELARKAVERQPQDPMAQIRLGHTLLLGGEEEEAGKVFRKARQLAPNDVQVWNGLLSYYLRTNQKEQAIQTLENLPNDAKLTAAQRSFILAQGYELIGDGDKAALHYKDAQRLAPQDVAVHLRIAEFLLNRDVEAAERTLRHVLKLDPQQGQARRSLASILVARGGEAEWQEAQTLLEAGGGAVAASLDQRLQANLLARRGGVKNRTKARQILEQLVLNPQASEPGDRLLLARLYEAEDKLLAARDQYVALVGREDPDPSHLSLFVDLLLRHEETDEAERWLRRLSELAPDDLNTISLQTRLLKAQQRDAEIDSYVEAYAKKQWDQLTEQGERTQLCLSIGNLYTGIEMHVAAQKWYEKLAELAPQAYQPLARCLAAQDRMAAAIELCKQKALTDKSPQAAIVLAAVLGSGEPRSEDYALAEPLLREALKAHKSNVDLLFSVAYIRTVQQRNEDAVALYEQIRALQPRHVPTLNNLAAVLSEMRGRQQEALKHANQAIDIAGPQPALLDTKAMVLLHSDPQQAVLLLLEATSLPDPDPRYYLHLALAYQRLGDLPKANKALEAARANELDEQTLTRSDSRLLEGLETALRSRT